MSIKNALAGMSVSDLPAAIKWYEDILESKPQQPMPELAEWQLPEGGWIQVFEDKDRAGHATMTLTVNELDDELRRLETLGVSVGEVQESELVRIAFVKDPDGNQIVLAQALSDKVAQ